MFKRLRLSILLTLLYFAIMLLGIMAYTYADEDCLFHTDISITGDNVPVPTHCIENEGARMEFSCGNAINITAKEGGWYYLNADDYQSDDYHMVEWYMDAGEETTINVDDNIDVAFLWVDSNIVGVVDLTADDCVERGARPDSRSNWGMGDHLAVVYSGQVYLPHGELVIQFDENSDFPVVYEHWLAVYYLEDTEEYQINILEIATGKVFEIISSDTTFTNVTIEIWE